LLPYLRVGEGFVDSGRELCLDLNPETVSDVDVKAG
jgi:hypothetical protein